MNHRYSHILTPVRVGNVVLRNRLFATKCISQELQGPENFPAESSIQFVEDLAKNGAALVVCTIGSWPNDRGKSFFTSEFQMENFRVLRYFVQEVQRVHAHNSLAIGGMMCSLPGNVEISEIRHPELIKKPLRGPGGPGGPGGPKPEITKEQIAEFIDNFARECVAIKTARNPSHRC